jgi:hypothetical protein
MHAFAADQKTGMLHGVDHRLKMCEQILTIVWAG